MSVKATRVTVTTSATRLDTQAEVDFREYGQSILVRNRDAAVSVYLGGADVTASTGTVLAALEDYGDALDSTDALYAITASGSVIVHVLQTGI